MCAINYRSALIGKFTKAKSKMSLQKRETREEGRETIRGVDIYSTDDAKMMPGFAKINPSVQTLYIQVQTARTEMEQVMRVYVYKSLVKSEEESCSSRVHSLSKGKQESGKWLPCPPWCWWVLQLPPPFCGSSNASFLGETIVSWWWHPALCTPQKPQRSLAVLEHA